jgi:hypothetical protein
MSENPKNLKSAPTTPETPVKDSLIENLRKKLGETVGSKLGELIGLKTIALVTGASALVAALIWELICPPPLQTLTMDAYLLELASKKGKTYAYNATMILSFEDTETASGKKRLASFRIVYDVLSVVDQKPGALFTEQYSTTTGKRFNWSGTGKETGRVGDGSYGIDISGMKKGEHRSLVTGANIVYELPLAATTYRGSLFCGEEQDFWSFPNTVEDAIGSITIVIDSPTTYIRPVAKGAKRIYEHAVTEDDVRVNEVDGGLPNARSLSYTFDRIKFNEEVGIHFTWAAQSANR